MLRVNHLSGFGRTLPSGGGSPGPIPTVRSVGGAASGVGAITPTLPTGHALNDILVLFLETHDEAITVAGWTEAGSSPSSNSGLSRLTVFWKRDNGSESNPTTSDSGDSQLGRIIAVQGCVTTGDPFNVTANGGTGTTASVSINGATTTMDNCLILAGVGHNRPGSTSHGAFTNASLSSLTVQIESGSVAGVDGGYLGVVSGGKATAGVYSATTMTINTARNWAGWSGALRPPLV